MNWLQKWDSLPAAARALILHNGRDMRKFYTLSAEERQNILDRIHISNTPDTLDAPTKRD